MSPDKDRLHSKSTPIMISDIHKKVAQARGRSQLDHNTSILSNNTFEPGMPDKHHNSQDKLAPLKTGLRAMHNTSQQPFSST